MLTQRWKNLLLGILFFVIPLKLSFTFIVFVPILILWLATSYRRLPRLIEETRQISAPLLFFLAVTLFSSWFGFDPLASTNRLIRWSISCLTIFIVYDWSSRKSSLSLLTSLIAGQFVASFHTVLSGAFPALPRMFIGAVSESGQLALTVPLCLGVILHAQQNPPEAAGFRVRFRASVRPVLAVLLLIVCALLGFAPYFTLPHHYPRLFLLAALVIIILPSLHILERLRRGNSPVSEMFGQAGMLLLPVLTAALLTNLKRGPWAGALVAVVVFLAVTRRRFAALLALVAAIVVLSLPPVQERLSQSSADFHVSGGRGNIWQVGVELATLYPLGIGYNNSSSLREYDQRIDRRMSHFHSNILNVLVETGWIGLAVYLWWIIGLLGVAFRGDELMRALGCALLSWQVAGLVEYNLGDSEVKFLALAVIGILARLRTESASARQSD